MTLHGLIIATFLTTVLSYARLNGISHLFKYQINQIVNTYTTYIARVHYTYRSLSIFHRSPLVKWISRLRCYAIIYQSLFFFSRFFILSPNAVTGLPIKYVHNFFSILLSNHLQSHHFAYCSTQALHIIWVRWRKSYVTVCIAWNISHYLCILYNVHSATEIRS